jgi:hypothetical protein
MEGKIGRSSYFWKVLRSFGIAYVGCRVATFDLGHLDRSRNYDCRRAIRVRHSNRIEEQYLTAPLPCVG